MLNLLDDSNAVINKSANIMKRSLLYMKFNGIEVCQNTWYLSFCIQRATFFHYKRKFINGNRMLVNGNSSSEKTRPINLETIDSLRNTTNENLDIDTH